MRASFARSAIALVALLLAPPVSLAIPRFGETVEAGGVQFLRDTDDPHLYHALPSAPRLATDDGGRPRFSLMEFSFRSDDGGTNAGALLNFMLTWGLDSEGQESALRALRKRDPKAQLAGALHVREGSYRVVARGESERWVLAEGKASLMPGQPIAFSRRLDAEETEKLKAVLASDDGAVSAGFLLSVEAMGPALSARYSIDWDALEQRQDLADLGATLRTTAASDADVRAVFDSLVADDVIQVEATGPLEAALAEVYQQFRSEAFETLVGIAAGQGAKGAALERRYVRRSTRRSGRISLTLDGSRSERRDLLITGDITDAIRGLGIGTPEAKAPSTDAT